MKSAIRVLVTYLIADFDGRGVDRMRTGLEEITVMADSFLDAVSQLKGGFLMDNGVYIMPSAILSVKRCVK